MRNRYLLYIALRGGEEDEFELVGESNSVFPSMWSVLFATSESAHSELQRVFGTSVLHVITTDAVVALGRLESLAGFLCDALAIENSAVSNTGQRQPDAIVNADARRYLHGAIDHLRELIAAWSFPDAGAPVLAVSFDAAAELPRTHPKEFIADCMKRFATDWCAIQTAMTSSCVSDVCIRLALGAASPRDITWKVWAGTFGLALFTHPYFYGAFRGALTMEYVDYDYDALGSENHLGHGRFRFQEAGGWGVERRIGDERHLVIEPEWDRILRAETDCSERVWLQRAGCFGLAALADGRVLREPTFDAVWPFHDGVALVRVGTKMGYLQTDGEWLLEPQWDEAWEFSHGYAAVLCDDKFTYIDRAGRSMLPPIFDAVESFTANGLARVHCGDAYGLLRSDGSFALDVEYRSLHWEDDLQAWTACRSGECALIRADGSVWLRGAYEKYSICVEGGFLTAHGANRVALLSWQGDVLFECEGQSLMALGAHQFLFVVANKGNTTLRDQRGEAVLPPDYLQVKEFETTRNVTPLDHVLVVRKHGRPKHGVWRISSATEIVPCRYDIIWAIPLDNHSERLLFFVATKTHVSSHARGLTHRVGILHPDGSTLIPECYAWIGDPTSLGKSNARERVCSAIEFALSNRGSLEAARWEDGVVERVALCALTVEC